MGKRCSKCKRLKRPGLFTKNKSRKDGLSSWCKSCKYKDRQKKFDSGDSDIIAAKILSNMKSRSKKKGFKPPEFTKEEIKDILDNGRCAVTNRGFNAVNITDYVKNPFKASPDRIDTNKGYTKDNVRWVMFWVNNCRGDYSIDFFRKLLRGVRW